MEAWLIVLSYDGAFLVIIPISLTVCAGRLCHLKLMGLTITRYCRRYIVRYLLCRWRPVSKWRLISQIDKTGGQELLLVTSVVPLVHLSVIAMFVLRTIMRPLA